MLSAVVCVGALPACARSASGLSVPEVSSSPAAVSSSPAASGHHHHELALPPVGPQVSVSFQGQHLDVTLTDLAHGATTIPVLDLWRAAFPAQDPAALHFDLYGSDGFHPSDRPPCARPLTIGQISAAQIDVATHDITYDPGLSLPGCYRVHAVVRFEARRD